MIEDLINLCKEEGGTWVIKYSIPMKPWGFSGDQKYEVEVEDRDPEIALAKACQEFEEFLIFVRQPF